MYELPVNTICKLHVKDKTTMSTIKLNYDTKMKIHSFQINKLPINNVGCITLKADPDPTVSDSN